MDKIYTLWKMIGVGFDFSFKQNKQEAVNFNLALGNTATTFNNVDNKLQTYWTIGLSYNL